MDTVLLPYKILFSVIFTILAIIVVGGAIYLKTAPELSNSAVRSTLTRAWYSVNYRVLPSALVSAAFTGARTTTTENSNKEVLSVPVLVYHGVMAKADGSEINLTEAQFRDHILALKKAGYHTLTLDELYRFKQGTYHPSGKVVVITFDDGRRDSFYEADPILAAVGYTTSMFAISKFSVTDAPGVYYLNTSELNYMMKTGRWELGAHGDAGHEDYPVNENGSLDHFYGNRLYLRNEGRIETTAEYQTRIDTDLTAAQTKLQDATDRKVDTFAFPFGDMGQNNTADPSLTDLLRMAAAAHYRMLFYQQWPGEYMSQTYVGDDRAIGSMVTVRRIDMRNTITGEGLVRMLQRGDAKTLPYSGSMTEDAGWTPAWGVVTLAKKAGEPLILRASSDQAGASTILDGSGHWDNYQVHLEGVSPNRTGFAIFLRFQNDANNAACNFGTEFAHVEQVINGEKRVIKGVRIPNMIPEGPFVAEAAVSGRTVTCTLNGAVVVQSEFLEPELDHGATGIKIWDAELGKSLLQVHTFSVKKI